MNQNPSVTTNANHNSTFFVASFLLSRVRNLSSENNFKKKILKFAIPKISDTRWKTPLMNSVVVYPSHGHGSKLGILRMRQVTVENDQHMLVPKPSNLNHTHTPKWPQNSKNESCSAVWSVAAITESTKFLPKLLWFAKIPKASEFGSLDSEFQTCPWKRPQISAVQKRSKVLITNVWTHYQIENDMQNVDSHMHRKSVGQRTQQNTTSAIHHQWLQKQPQFQRFLGKSFIIQNHFVIVVVVVRSTS